MSLIEGVGDEVTVFFVFLLLFLVLALAWVSTNVSDLSTINVIVVDRRGFQRWLQRISNLTARGFQANLQTDGNGGNASSETPPDGTSVDPPDSTGTENNGVQDVDREVDAGIATSEEEETLPSLAQQSSDNLSPTSATSIRSSVAASEVVPRETEQEQTNEASASLPEPVLETELLDQELLRKTRLAFFEKLSNKEHSTEPEVTETSSRDEPQTVEDITSSAAEAVDSPSNQEASGNNQNEAEEPQRLEGHIRIRLKYLNDRQRLVQAKPEDTVGEFKRQHFAAELAENLLVRCIFNGQELRPDSSTLQSYNIVDESVIHCLSQTRPAPENNNAPEQEDWDIGSLMFPLFGVILVLIWYCRFCYRAYFNAMSTFSLIGITLMYVVAILATWRTHEPVHQHQD